MWGLKLELFAVLSLIEIIVFVKRFVLVSLPRQWHQLKIRWHTAQALDPNDLYLKWMVNGLNIGALKI
jgi:hypothetical protein